MLDTITGDIVKKGESFVVLRTGGIGFSINVPRRILADLPDSGEATLICHLAVREDSMKVYGFESEFERELFRKLNSVAGVGAATALLLLSDFTPARLIEAIMQENALQFQRVKGIGAKTAKRIALELKGKVEELGLAAGVRGREKEISRNVGEDLMAALIGLGYPRSKARDAAARVLSQHPGEEDLEKLIKHVLGAVS